MAALAVTDVVDVILGLEQQPLFSQFLDHGLAGFHAVQADEVLARLLGHRAIRTDDDRDRQFVAQAHLIVVRIVRRRDLHAAGAELRIDEIIRDDRDRLCSASGSRHLRPIRLV